jgi:hypothetical protein
VHTRSQPRDKFDDGHVVFGAPAKQIMVIIASKTLRVCEGDTLSTVRNQDGEDEWHSHRPFYAFTLRSLPKLDIYTTSTAFRCFTERTTWRGDRFTIVNGEYMGTPRG